MSKTRSFSIYLLKEGYGANNSLKDSSSLGKPITQHNLPAGASLYIADNDFRPPWWKSYFAIQKDINQALKGAIVFLPIKNRCFALTFGHVSHNLEEASYEYDFGLRATLNSIDPDKLKSLDSIDPKNARQQRIQLPIGSDLTYFGFDGDSTILKNLAGKVKEEYKKLFKQASGFSSIRISSDVDAEGLMDLCEKLLIIYDSKEYLTKFPGIHNISPVKDPTIVNRLNEKLVNAMRTKEDNVTLALPTIVDHNEEICAIFSGVGRGGLVYYDIFIDKYYEYLEEQNFKYQDLNIGFLKKHQLILTNEEGKPKGSAHPSIFKCLIFDTTLDQDLEVYHLCDGNWYEVNSNYISELNYYLDPLCKDSSLPNCKHSREEDFNSGVSEDSQFMICLDKTNISPKGQTALEPCDIFEVMGDFAVMHHVKISTVSSKLSHLFAQGFNSIELLRGDELAVENLKKVIKEELIKKKDPKAKYEIFEESIKNNKFKVSFQIITHKDKDKKSLNLPLFSRISLKRRMKELRLMGIEAEFCFVKDEAPKKPGKKKRKKIPKNKK